MYIVATKTLSLTIDRNPDAPKRAIGWLTGSSCSTHSRSGLNSFLLMDHPHDCEEHDEKGRERQSGFKGFAQATFVYDAGKRGSQHDNCQAYYADLGDVEREREHQHDSDDCLYDNHMLLAWCDLR